MGFPWQHAGTVVHTGDPSFCRHVGLAFCLTPGIHPLCAPVGLGLLRVYQVHTGVYRGFPDAAGTAGCESGFISLAEWDIGSARYHRSVS